MRQHSWPSMIVLLLLTLTGCSSLFLHPTRNMQESPAVRIFEHRDVIFEAPDGVPLHGWYFPARNPRGTVLVLHGNAQNLSTHVNGVLWLVLEGYNIFIIDYRGYGYSGGEQSLDGAHLDADAALEKLMTLRETDPDRVAVLGQSLGGAIAVHTVANSRHKDRIRALVVDSSFASYRRIAREKLAGFWLTWPFQVPLSWTVTDDFSAEKWIAKVAPVPVLILHGTNDPVVPTHHGKELFAAARDPKELWLTDTPGHSQSFAEASVRTRVARYLDAAIGTRRLAAGTRE